MEKSTSDKTYSCIHCGFESNTPFNFCPVCEKNIQGKALAELKAIFNQ